MSGIYRVLLNDEGAMKQTADKRYPLGTRGYTKDGRTFRYCKNGASAVAVGLVVQSPVVQSTGLSAGDNYFASAPTTNSTYVKLRLLSTKTLLGSTDNFYADGFVTIRTGTGAGQMVRILSHEGATTTALAGHKVNLPWDVKLSAAPVTTTAVRVGVITSPFNRVVVGSTLGYQARTGIPVGVTPRAVTANYYFWAQTGGLAPVKQSAKTYKGNYVRMSTAVAGCVCRATVATTTAIATRADLAAALSGVVGQVYQITGSTAATQYPIVNLSLD